MVEANRATVRRVGPAAAIRESAAAATASRAAWFYGAIWLACVGDLLLRGQVVTVLIGAGAAAGSGVLAAITIAMTARAPAPSWTAEPISRDRTRLALQVVLLLMLSLLIVEWLLDWKRLLPHVLTAVPAWTWFYDHLGRAEFHLALPPGFLTTPVIYGVLPLVLTLALGARPRELGLGRGYRAWRVTAVWCALPAVVILVQLATGRSVVALLRRLLTVAMTSGPWEEFLYRGALLTRVAGLWGAGWGIVLSSLMFGLLHVATNVNDLGLGTDLLTGAAAGVVMQGTGAIGFAVATQRTGNLLATSVTHVVFNSIG